MAKKKRKKKKKRKPPATKVVKIPGKDGVVRFKRVSTRKKP